jgi:hypothetical protein
MSGIAIVWTAEFGMTVELSSRGELKKYSQRTKLWISQL